MLRNPEGLYKIELCRLPLRHRFYMSCECHVMGSLIILVNKRADWNVPVSYIKYMSTAVHVVSALKKQQKSQNTILKVIIFKHSVILFILDVVWFVNGQNHEIIKTAISVFYIRFHPVYRPCFYVIWKHMTPFYW